jgi:tetratricopeptide (TPR) repeat protein
VYESADEDLRREPTTRSWYAWHLAGLGRREEAVAIFKALLQGGHDDEDDLAEYARLLHEMKRTDEAVSVFEGFVALRPSTALRNRYSAFLLRAGRSEDALRMLDRAQAAGFDPQLAYARMAHLQELGRHSDVVDTAEDLIKRGYESGDAYFWRGRAEYRLKWHRRAKASFEKALELSKQDQDIREWRDHVSAELGEGNNSDVKEAIAQVALAPEVQALLKDLP